jgi:sensor domain CHASE-containing protein
MAIEFIPRKTQEIPTEKIFFFVSLGILIFITGLSVFLVVSNQEKEKIKTDLGNQITQLQSKEINELEGQVLFRKMQLEKAK